MEAPRSERGQSVVIGSILIFALIISFLGLVQAFVVPDQIAAEETNHAAQIENEFTELYTAATGVTGGSERSATITLGTTYNSRAFLITPPPATGSLRSEKLGTITTSIDKEDEIELENVDAGDDFVADTCGFGEVEVGSLQYSAEYNEYRNAGQYTYETGVRYKSFPDATVGTQQRLIRAGGGRNNINLMPLTNGSVNAQGTTAESVAFEAGATGVVQPFEVTDNDAVTIEIPVNDPDAWQEIYGSSEGDIDFDYNPDSVELTLNQGEYRFKCTPVGIDDRPNNSPDSPTPPGNGTDEDVPFNPIGEDDLVYLETRSDGSGAEWDFRNRDTADSKNVTKIRVPWSSVPGNQGEELELTKDSQSITVTVAGGDYTDVPGGWTWSNSQKDHIDVVGVGSANPNAEFSIIMEFEDGTTRTYLVSAPTP